MKRLTTGRFNESRSSQISAQTHRTASSQNKYILCKLISKLLLKGSPIMEYAVEFFSKNSSAYSTFKVYPF